MRQMNHQSKRNPNANIAVSHSIGTTSVPPLRPAAPFRPAAVVAAGVPETATAVTFPNRSPRRHTTVGPPTGLAIVLPVASDSVAVPFVGKSSALKNSPPPIPGREYPSFRQSNPSLPPKTVRHVVLFRSVTLSPIVSSNSGTEPGAVAGHEL